MIRAYFLSLARSSLETMIDAEIKNKTIPVNQFSIESWDKKVEINKQTNNFGQGTGDL